MPITTNIVLYHYPYSPYARKIYYYLLLQNIQFAQCVQPSIMPRPDLSEVLGITYRRIPLLAIGRNIFADTRLIMAELSRRFPEAVQNQILGPDPSAGVLTKFLDDWSDEIFTSAIKLLPKDLPLMRDPKFLQDRADFAGASFGKGHAHSRKEALTNIRSGMFFLENKLLRVGKPWLLGSDRPTILDLLAIWPFDWLITLPGSLNGSDINPSTFPRTFKWINEFQQLLRNAPSLKSIPTITGQQAKDYIFTADLENDVAIDEKDPQGFLAGDIVEVVPTDSGVNHPQMGILLGLQSDQVVLDVSVPQDNRSVMLHFPRARYQIKKIGHPQSKV